MDRKKKQKTLTKVCPECEGELEIVLRIHEEGGVEYSESYEECLDCSYSQKLRTSQKRYGDIYNPKW